MLIKFKAIPTFDCCGLFGTLTYENPSPHPVGSATPVNCRRHFPFTAAMNARVVFQGAVLTCNNTLMYLLYKHIIIEISTIIEKLSKTQDAESGK